MRKILLLVWFGLSVATLKTLAQDLTSGERNSILVSNEIQKNGLVIPMMDKMFLSNVTHEIGKYNQMNFREVRSFFIKHINDMAALTSINNCVLNSVTDVNDSMAMKIQVAVGYDYDLVKVHSKKEETKIQKFWSQFQTKHPEKISERGSYLENGEIKEFYDGEARFMNAKVDTAWVFGNVLSDYDTDYVLFINELDIHKPRPNEPNFGAAERNLKLHFTLYSGDGERLYGNAAFSTFAEHELDIYSIANDALFSAINRMLAECSAHLTTLSELKN